MYKEFTKSGRLFKDQRSIIKEKSTLSNDTQHYKGGWLHSPNKEMTNKVTHGLAGE